VINKLILSEVLGYVGESLISYRDMISGAKQHVKLQNFMRLFILGVGILTILMSACVPATTPQPLLAEKRTATSTPSPTPTVEWFPATATPTIVPTIASTPTPEQTENQGDIILSDDFSDPELWVLGSSSSGNISLGVNELTIAIAEPGAYDYSIRREPLLGDYHIEITASATLCQGEDQYGLLLRMSSPGNFYRYGLSCDGRVRLDKVIQGTATSPQPWIQNNSLPPGAPSHARLAVHLHGEEMKFFINDQYQFTVNDPSLQIGSIGVFARSQGENAVTVNFSELVVRQVFE
jgi:hypothetical protein